LDDDQKRRHPVSQRDDSDDQQPFASLRFASSD
jgi:hypothetical protein